MYLAATLLCRACSLLCGFCPVRCRAGRGGDTVHICPAPGPDVRARVCVCVASGGGSAEEAQHWACRTYVQVLRQLPVLARAWRSGCERQLAQHVQRLTSDHVSPLLLREEFGRLQTADTVTDNMTVRRRTIPPHRSRSGRPTRSNAPYSYRCSELDFVLFVA